MNTRMEHPRPQFFRAEWLSLNGEWEFEIDYADSGRERGIMDRALSATICVPFCPESELSGVNHKDFMNVVWYRKIVTIPGDWRGKRVLLHIQACDYDTTVWVNGTEAATHRGGFTPFSCELTRFAQPGEEVILLVRARDYAYENKAAGKQKTNGFANSGCHYYRTTGIWQTVWMEAVGQEYLLRPRLTPEIASSSLYVEQPLSGCKPGMTMRIAISDQRGEITSSEIPIGLDFVPRCRLTIPADRLRLWSTSDPHLYTLRHTLLDVEGQIVDEAHTYAGMRSVSLQGKKFLLNGKSVFQRQVLDQGYYPDGIMTAPSDEALVHDIRIAMEAGFNTARLHQKVFEERFLYHADRLGYLVWGEFGDWGHDLRMSGPNFKACDPYAHHPQLAMFRQWAEALERDFNHPCIIGWCPLNETNRPASEPDRITALDDLTFGLFHMTKNVDRTRPVLDVSGYCHRVYETDVYDCHDYAQDVDKFREHYAHTAEGQIFLNTPATEFINTPYRGQPYFCSEFGGIKWSGEPDSAESWGYGQAPKSEEEFLARFKGLCDVLLDNQDIFGYCYTQLTDVCQEQNGLYYFNRQPKFPVEQIRSIQVRRAAIEDIQQQ